MAKGGTGGGKPSGSGAVIKGSGQDDILSDGGLAAILAGGRGDDLYLVADPDTVIEEDERGGTDTVRTALDWTLDPWVENLELTGSGDLAGTGNAGDNRILGNDGDNLLAGLGGADTLDGGAGDDTLAGGAGDDLLLGGEGADTALFEGALGDYTLTREGDGIRVAGADGRDLLRGIETLVFADAVVDASTVGAPAPVAVADSLSGTEDSAAAIDVLSNDSGEGLQIAAVAAGSKGSVAVNADGTLTYRPFADAWGEDSFGYTVVDAAGRTASATVSVSLAAVNDAPAAADDAFAVEAGAGLTGNVLGNDGDPDGDALAVTGHDAASAAGGSVSIAADGTLSYTAPDGFQGSDSFGYTVGDGQGGSDTATVTVEVGGVPYYVEGLLFGTDGARMNWPAEMGSAVTVTYAFLTDLPDYYYWWSADPATFDAFTEQQQQATRAVLQTISEMTGIGFVETAPTDAGMTFGTIHLGGGTGVAHRPEGDGVGQEASDVWLDAAYAGDSFEPGTRPYFTLLHEIGHALGLDHATLPSGEDNQKYTVMSGGLYPTIGGDADGYALYDVAALQYLYGANTGHAAGDDVYDAAMLAGRTEVIWDGGGTDAIDLSGAGYAVAIDLRPGAFSTAHPTGSENIAITFGAVIENATGGAHGDVLTGNDAANRLDGGGGDDRMTGGEGSDLFAFGAGSGADLVTDFRRGEDMVDLTGSGVTYADLDIRQNGVDTEIASGGDVLTLAGVGGVTEADFLFA